MIFYLTFGSQRNNLLEVSYCLMVGIKKTILENEM